MELKGSFDGHFNCFYAWMQDQLQNACPEWTLNSPLERQCRIKLISEANIDGEMVCGIGPYLAVTLQGKKAPLDLAIKGEPLSKYQNQYGQRHPEITPSDPSGSKRALSHVATLLRPIVHKILRAEPGT